ncbi:heavy metal translocating P-type ATPase [Plasticicumulans acidivorans]|uniref:P-type Zn(2+) transporter n=1 Tax=Plasticicumulans acidivorans TaxID=886464 RepID=A0A317MWK3_9GAMM|nr:heavy metal translocating P-type ATPase [Plasticicumulans acidivorans]PWV63191.1 P-type E1-E2 ATPase/heavy metal translocating P-type ATPase [Plasticicumulans acidivorans]
MWQIVHETRGRLRLRLPAASTAAGALALETLPGVSTVRVNAACGALVVEFDGQPATRERLFARLQAADATHGTTLPAVLSEAPDDASGLISAGAWLLLRPLLPWPLRTLLSWFSLSGTISRGLRALAERGVCVEALDATALTIAALRGEHGSAGLTRFLIELSNYLEARTVRRADDSLRRLLHVRPQRVWIERDGVTVAVDYDTLQGGELVVVGTGESIPVDGSVVAGEALVNQASVTGESLPLPRNAGMTVLAGTHVDSGRLVIRAERVGDATTTARISRYLLDALDRPAEVQTVANALADRRVSITLGAAALVFLTTRNLRRVESVFLVDFACAVKLGTPLALKAAMLQAAREGCLIRGGEMLERLAGVDTVVFDKTGTLTHATLEVTDVLPLGAFDEDQLLALTASIAEHSTHPVAEAVVALAQHRGVPHIDHEAVDFIVGHGLHADVDCAPVRIGSRHYLETDEGISLAPLREQVQRFAAEGKSLLYVSRGEEPIGVFALRDRVRREARTVIRQLRRQGVREIVMLTGDHGERARAIATQLRLDRVVHDCQPEDKAALINELRAQGRRVAFVGDGVNDGPALMSADVGIAMPRAADIARATAGIVLLEDRLDGLARLHARSRATLALIESNFRIAVGANALILIAAAFGRLSPVAASALHNGTTIALLLRALAAAAYPSRHLPRSPTHDGHDHP